jgi:1,4-alpha-glucan branching enzyme
MTNKPAATSNAPIEKKVVLPKKKKKFEEEHFIDSSKPVWPYSLFTDEHVTNFQNGTHYRLYEGYKGLKLDKGDPYAHFWEKRPYTASIAWGTFHEWKDNDWMKERKNHNALTAPWSVYEVHLASWMRPDKNDEESYNTYAEITARLVPYVKEMGFTHVELMPVMEHPFDGSWGYQGTGYFAPTSRFGSPQDFAAMVDAFHQAGLV